MSVLVNLLAVFVIVFAWVYFVAMFSYVTTHDDDPDKISDESDSESISYEIEEDDEDD